MALLWINRWIGHVTRIKHRDTRLEYRASKSKSIKWVERKGLAWKDGQRTSEELVVAHITTKGPIREEAKYYNKQRMQHLLLRQKNRHVMWSMYAWHGNYDAMQLIQIKRNQNPDTQIYDSNYFTTRHFKSWLAWQNKVWVIYTKLNEAGKTLGNPQLPHMLYIRCNATTSPLHDANKYMDGIFRFYKLLWLRNR
jgi:hypothetical protein